MELPGRITHLEEEGRSTGHQIDISVIVPISERYDNLDKVYSLYAAELRKLNKTYEFIFVIDGDFEDAFNELRALKKGAHEIKIIKFSQHFGESVALMVGFHNSSGQVILTLASYLQVEPFEIGRLLRAIEEGSDLVIARRYPRIDSFPNRIQSYIFHWLIGKLVQLDFHDIACGLRCIRREVFEDLNLYGDLHRFIPLLAHRRGYKITELDVKQRKEDAHLRLYGPGVYFRRLLDILNIFFIVKFTMRPFRFFGLIGSSLFGTGLFISIYLVIFKLIKNVALANRPFLLLGVLLMVVGIQILAIGLIGEIIIFTSSSDNREYKVELLLE